MIIILCYLYRPFSLRRDVQTLLSVRRGIFNLQEQVTEQVGFSGRPGQVAVDKKRHFRRSASHVGPVRQRPFRWPN